MLALNRAAWIAAALISASLPAFGQPAERVVVMHHGLAVGADLQIAFDAVAAGDRRVKALAVFSMTPAAASCSPRWAIGRAMSHFTFGA